MKIALATTAGMDGIADAVERAAAADRPLVDALVAREVEVATPAWTDPSVNWAGFDLVVVRTTWDYTQRRDQFVDWADHVGQSTQLVNPPDVLRWNGHKSYLLELEDRGAPVIPTAWLGGGDTVELAELMRVREWSQVVLKPAVGSGGRGLVRVDEGDDPAVGQRYLDVLAATGDAMVQPYIDAVRTSGEVSVIVAEGKATHAVRKRPSEGEYRVHEHRGGHNEVIDADSDTIALAEWIVESAGDDLALARVDLIEDEVGSVQLAELELIEPDLYLAGVDAAVATIADGLIRRAARDKPTA